MRIREVSTVSMSSLTESSDGERAGGRVPGPLAKSLAFALVVVLCSQARAQTPILSSVNEFVLLWIQGNYASPLVCKIGDRAQRGLRRILIEAGSVNVKPGSAEPAVGVVRFVDLEVQGASRCSSEVGGSTPNITGELRVRHPITRLRDTALRDFEAELRRKYGFELEIVKGSLLLSEVGAHPPRVESLDFRGGKLRVHLLRRGSDGLRLLEDLPSPRKLMLEFTTRAGRTLSFPSSLAKPKSSLRGDRPSRR